MERLEDAIAENDPSQSVIVGAYTNSSAEVESITRPHVNAQEGIFQKIFNQSDVDPHDVGSVEMHGIDTQAGDASEIIVVLKIFAPQIARKRKRRSEALCRICESEHRAWWGSLRGD